MAKIILPKTYKGSKEEFHGKPSVSWSQIETWIGKKGFNTGLLGRYEYIRKYFFGETYPDMGWGTFGNEAEAYITLRGTDPKTIEKEKVRKEFEDSLVNFTDKEKAIMDTITPLGNYQHELVIDFKDFVLLGYIDDHSDDFTHIRDYKTKSEASKKDLTSDKTYQLEIYSLYIQKQLGIEVKKHEYCIIERLGGAACMKGGGRKSLSIGERVWYEDKIITQDRLKETEALVIKSVNEISDYWKTFQKYNR